MKRVFLLVCPVIAVAFFFISSCKKTQHPTNPTPSNYRLLSYTKVTDVTYSTENYTFFYDANNRVSQVLFTTNEATSPYVSTRSLFFYTNDSIFKVTTNVVKKDTIEIDTFIKNPAGLISIAYFKGRHAVNYQYFGKLLSWVSDTFSNGGVSVASGRTYTSDNADLLSLNFDGVLHLTVEDSVLRVVPVTGKSPDTVIAGPLAVTWTTTTSASHSVKPSILRTTQIGPGTYDTTYIFYDQLSGNTLSLPVSVSGTDANGIVIPMVTYPGGAWPKESYGVFPDKDDRVGDYFQLQSFTTYGVNIFQNAHLLKSITNPGHTTNITYVIDADSKISTTTATTIDSVGHQHVVVYNLQYETH
jgi:hypothetical protein